MLNRNLGILTAVIAAIVTAGLTQAQIELDTSVASPGTGSLLVDQGGGVAAWEAAPAAPAAPAASPWTDTGTALHPSRMPRNVGIGTTAASFSLEVEGTNPVLAVDRSTTASTAEAVLQFSQVNSVKALIGIPGGGGSLVAGSAKNDLVFRTANGQKMLWTTNNGANAHMVLGSDGKLGVGTTAPSSALDVIGDIEISGSRLHVSAASGRVGIGTATPAYQLEIEGTSPTLSIDSVTGSTSGSQIFFTRANGIRAIIGMPGGSGSIIGGSAAHDLVFRVNQKMLWSTNNGATAHMVLDHDGNLGVGTLTPNSKLDVNGGIAVAGMVVHASDARLKKDIRNVSAALDKVSQLNGVTWAWKDNRQPGTQMGVVAQDVEKVAPELVVEHDDGYKSVNYAGLNALTIEAIKELRAENVALKRRLAKLEAVQP